MTNSAKPVVPVFFTIDEGYAPWLAVALASMKTNAAKDRHYDVHIVQRGLEEETKARLMALGDEDFEIIVDDMPHDLSGIQDWKGNWLRADYFTLTIFYRLFLPEQFPQYDKAIYIDSDIVVPGDIAKLFDTDLEGNLLGVVNDYSIAAVPELQHYVNDAIGVDGKHYFNSGVLLMDFKQLREKHLASRFLELLETYSFDTIAPDQDYLNALCKDRVHYLDPTWDAMPCDLEPFENPQLIHYNLFDKPWCYDNVKYEDYFWKYVKDSGFEKEIRAHKDSYSDEQKDSDAKAMALLVSRADEIPDQDVLMKNIIGIKEARL